LFLCYDLQSALPVCGPEAIRAVVSQLRPARQLCAVDLSEGSVDAQRSEGGGIVVVVTGLFSAGAAAAAARPFVQTFFLAWQPAASGKVSLN
jgi:hypothetical protein